MPNVVLAGMFEPMPPSSTISARLPPPIYSSAEKPSLPSDVSLVCRWIATVAAS